MEEVTKPDLPNTRKRKQTCHEKQRPRRHSLLRQALNKSMGNQDGKYAPSPLSTPTGTRHSVPLPADRLQEQIFIVSPRCQ